MYEHEVISVHGIAVDNVAMTDALDRVVAAARGREPTPVYFVNANCINIAARDPAFRAVLTDPRALVFPDGTGIRLAGRLTGQPVVDNVNGTDLFPLLCSRCAEEGLAMSLLGAKPGVAEGVRDNMLARVPRLRVARVHHGYFDRGRPQAVLDLIRRSGSEVLLVALGPPLQEKFIATHLEHFGAKVVLGVGGLFDIYSGQVPRAPAWMRRAGIEWSWRLLQEPERLWRRYLIGNAAFICRILWWRLRRRAGVWPERGARSEPPLSSRARPESQFERNRLPRPERHD